MPSSTTSVPSTSFDKAKQLEDARTPLEDPELGGCFYVNATSGTVDFVQEGTTFGANVHGPCSPAGEWPVVCNPSIPNGGMEYPYCVFATEKTSSNVSAAAESQRMKTSKYNSNTVVCARTEERVVVTKPDGTSQECSCLYFNPLSGPSSSCPMIKVSLSSPLATVSHTGGNGVLSLPPTPLPMAEEDDRNKNGSTSAASRTSFLSYCAILIFSSVIPCITGR